MSRYWRHEDDSADGFNDETRLFHRYRRPDGVIESLDDVKCNGAGIPRPTLSSREEKRQTDIVLLLQTYRALMYNLTSIERRIFVQLLRGRSIEQVAVAFKCSRPNVYCRIRGDRKGYGGMIVKNENVDIWWRRRREKGLTDFEF
jgi:hypothetical protein